MNAELKKQWVEALRSGKYVQGRGMLRSCSDKFCCLGVLCDIVNSQKWVPLNPIMYAYTSQWGGLHSGGLSEDIKALGDINDDIPLQLANKNDGGQTFEEIASWIEANL